MCLYANSRFPDFSVENIPRNLEVMVLKCLYDLVITYEEIRIKH